MGFYFRKTTMVYSFRYTDNEFKTAWLYQAAWGIRLPLLEFFDHGNSVWAFSENGTFDGVLP